MIFLETLGVMLFCIGFFVSVVAYGVLGLVGRDCSSFRQKIHDELNYLPVQVIDKRVDMYLGTMAFLVFAFILSVGCVIISIVLEPDLFYCVGFMLIGLYVIVFIYNFVFEDIEMHCRVVDLTRRHKTLQK